jgi:hypothetical protein
MKEFRESALCLVGTFFLSTCLFAYIMAKPFPFDLYYDDTTWYVGMGPGMALEVLIWCVIVTGVGSTLEVIVWAYPSITKLLARVLVIIQYAFNLMMAAMPRAYNGLMERVPACIDNVIGYLKDLNERMEVYNEQQAKIRTEEWQIVKDGSKGWLKKQLRGPAEKVMEWVDVAEEVKETAVPDMGVEDQDLVQTTPIKVDSSEEFQLI